MAARQAFISQISNLPHGWQGGLHLPEHEALLVQGLCVPSSEPVHWRHMGGVWPGSVVLATQDQGYIMKCNNTKGAWGSENLTGCASPPICSGGFEPGLSFSEKVTRGHLPPIQIRVWL
jgi:hypothetical protein